MIGLYGGRCDLKPVYVREDNKMACDFEFRLGKLHFCSDGSPDADLPEIGNLYGRALPKSLRIDL